MDAQELLEYIAFADERADRVEILNNLRDEAMSKSELADCCGVSRGAVQFPPDIDGLLVKQSQEDYYLTGAGAIAIREYMDVRDAVVGGDLDSIIHNPNQRICLRNLRVQSLTRGGLADRPNMPSRRTIDRLTASLEDAGYIVRTEDADYTLTDSGERMVEKYEELVHAFEQILAKRQCLEWIGVEADDIPVAALNDARLEVTRPGQAFKAVYEILDYVKSYNPASIDHVRVMASFANNQFDKELGKFVRAGSRVDVLSPANLAYSYPSMDEKDLEWSRRLLEPANASWLLHRGTLPCSIILLDEEAVTISPTYTGVSGDTFGVLFSTNSDVTRWATDFFEGHMSNDLVRAGQWPRMVQMTQASEYIEPLNSEG